MNPTNNPPSQSAQNSVQVPTSFLQPTTYIIDNPVAPQVFVLTNYLLPAGINSYRLVYGTVDAIPQALFYQTTTTPANPNSWVPAAPIPGYAGIYPFPPQ